MTSDIDLTQLPAPAQKVFAPDAPAPLRMMAARGVLPGLKPAEIVQVVGLFATGSDEKLRETAAATLAKLPEAMLSSALSVDLPASTVGQLARAYENRHEVLERLLRMPRIDGDTLEYLAVVADERSGELIATNEELMLAYPRVIEKLYMNKRVRMSTADRLIELAVRNDVELDIPAYKEAAQAIKNELIAEPSEEPTYDDIVFNESEQAAQKADLGEDEDTHEVDDEGEERLREKFVPLYAIIGQLTVTQKIRRAMLGTAAERLLLVRDSNRLVAAAAVKSPLMRDNEAVQISASRAVSEDVLRAIAQKTEFIRNYQVKVNLVSNPRTPFAFSSRFVQHLRDNDIRALAKSKNVRGDIALAAKQHMLRKQGKT
ncbi:MAG TPA: hypothetical protein VG937_28535 [Polyangiaceae bacterium]|jgi:hypothetical protein|nr:hypothetical protein [Polyangiaceae bacterium]